MIIFCAYCGKEHNIKPSHKKENNFCSKECYNKWRSENKIGINNSNYNRIKHNCDFCNKEMNIIPSIYKELLEGKRKHIYCSKDCKNNSQKGLKSSNNKSLIKICETCGEEYKVKNYRKDISKYCSVKCRQIAEQNNKNTIYLNCDNCGKDIHKMPSQIKEHNFCSLECLGEWNGKKNENKIEKECIICKNKYNVVPSKFDTSITCSVKCQSIWQKEIYNKQPEVIEFRRKIAIKNIQNQKYSDTKPEILTKEFFIKNNIEFIPQHSMYNMFVVDFYLPKFDIVIEVLGNYWHGNPEIYGFNKKKLSKKQIKIKRKDINKFFTLIEKGHNVYGVWEKDIYDNIDNAFKFLIS